MIDFTYLQFNFTKISDFVKSNLSTICLLKFVWSVKWYLMTYLEIIKKNNYSYSPTLWCSQTEDRMELSWSSYDCYKPMVFLEISKSKIFVDIHVTYLKINK